MVWFQSVTLSIKLLSLIFNLQVNKFSIGQLFLQNLQYKVYNSGIYYQKMRAVGQKFLQYTSQFREIHHTLRMDKIKDIMAIPRSQAHFERQFPEYPIQFSWKYKDMDLHAYVWEPKKQLYQRPRALLINFNALNAHTGLSGSMAQNLADNGILMTGVDYPNFGKSYSPFPGHIQSLHGLVELSEGFLKHTIEKYPGIPVYLNGMSMGGLIAFQIALRKPTLVNGCILLNPAFRDNPINNGFLKRVIMLGGMIFPKLQTMKPLKSHSTKHSLQKYKQKDKLMYSGKVWTSTTWALLSNMRRISKQEHFQRFNLPFLCIQGGSDKILNPFTVFQLEQNSKSKDKEIVIIPDMWHALWFDDHLDDVIQMVREWILDRVQSAHAPQKQDLKASQAHKEHHGRHIKHPHHPHSQISKENQDRKGDNQ